jgi:lipid A disaccharide synthetase
MEVAAVLRRFEAENCRLVQTGEPVSASAVLTSSGTMSLHCALAGIPGAIAYRTNPVTYWLARWWVRLEYIGIANLLLKEPMYPEFIQGAATGDALAEEGTTRLLLDVAEDNTPARRLYVRLGFTEDGRRKGYYTAGRPAPVDALLMSRAIGG